MATLMMEKVAEAAPLWEAVVLAAAAAEPVVEEDDEEEAIEISAEPVST
jgi:hypothetical protein